MSMAIDKNHPLNVQAWADGMMWALGDPDRRKQFTADTGIELGAAAATPIDRMVDDAVGRTASNMEAFFTWWNEQWGEDMVPDRVDA